MFVCGFTGYYISFIENSIFMWEKVWTESMDQATHNKIVSFIGGIADDVYRISMGQKGIFLIWAVG